MRAVHRRHPQRARDVDEREDRRDHRLVAAERGEVVHHPDVVLGLPEEVRDARSRRARASRRGTCGRVATIRCSADAAPAARRRRCRTRRPRATSSTSSRAYANSPPGSLPSAGGSPPSASTLSMPAARYVSSSSMMSARVWPTQVRCGIVGNGYVRVQVEHDLPRPLARAPERAVRHRDERRIRSAASLGSAFARQRFGFVVLRREELEGDRRPSAQQIGDVRHAHTLVTPSDVRLPSAAGSGRPRRRREPLRRRAGPKPFRWSSTLSTIHSGADADDDKSDGLDALEPRGIDLRLVLDQVRTRPVLLRDLDHPQRVRRVRRSDHEDERRALREDLHRGLPVRRRVADVGLRRRLDVRGTDRRSVSTMSAVSSTDSVVCVM